MEKLKPCPFCGNDSTDPHSLQRLEVVEGTGKAWGLPAARLYFVRCGTCFAQGGNGVTGHRALTGATITEAQARQIAIDKWNRRTGQEAGA